MSIAPPNIAFRSKTAASITVQHQEPVNFSLPSTAWVRSIISAVGSEGDSVQAIVTTAGPIDVTLSGLAGEQTYTITAVAESDADEISIPTAAIKKFVTADPYTDTLGFVFERMLPPVDETPILSHEAVIRFLDAIGFELQDGTKTAWGMNAFIDNLPEEAYKQAAADLDPPDEILILAQNEPVAFLNNRTYNHQVDTVVALSVYGGNRDSARIDAARLYRFFQQRVNVQFQVCGFTAHVVRPLGEPSLVGMEDNGLSVYQFRLAIRGARTDLTDSC